MIKPVYKYLLQNDITKCEEIKGNAKILSYDGRRGVITKSIHSYIKLDSHTINENEGTASLWVMSMEDLDSMTQKDNMKISNPYFNYYTLLSDIEDKQNFDESTFSFVYDNDWYPTLTAKCYKGRRVPDGYYPKIKAIVGVGHFSIHKHKWYNLVLSWNRKESRMKLYANGVLLNQSDTVHKMEFEKAGDILYAGNPTLAISDICFYDKELSTAEINELFKKEDKMYPDIQESLRSMFDGVGRQDFDFVPDETWVKKCDRLLNTKEDLDYFYIQGQPDAASLTDEGIYIKTTQDKMPIHGAYSPDMDACYLWTKQFFEGDLYLEYEFKSLHKDGLSLLMVQASGMQREDFMEDYPLRNNGSMSTVCWEDVRNYDWEYYRYVSDVRNDTSSHVMLKNPWLKGMGYSCSKEQLAIGEWHKLQFLQIDNHIIGAIDGKIVIDAYDDPFNNNGPVLSAGRIAIRCMVRTKLMVRNFKVFNRSQLEGAEYKDIL